MALLVPMGAPPLPLRVGSEERSARKLCGMEKEDSCVSARRTFNLRMHRRLPGSVRRPSSGVCGRRKAKPPLLSAEAPAAGGVIYTPVDNSKVVMRPVISREEAEALIRDIPSLQPAACPSVTTQALTQHYQTSLRRHSCRSLMELTMGIYQKRRRAEAQNRRLGMVDQRFMKQAEQLLYGELSAALDIPYEEVQPYIAGHAGAGTKC